jgi:hypothetical protein
MGKLFPRGDDHGKSMEEKLGMPWRGGSVWESNPNIQLPTPGE